MAVLSVIQVTRSGVADTLVAADSEGDSFPNTGREWLEISNGGGAPVTLNIAGVVDGQTVAALRSYSIAAGARRKIGPFPTSLYNDTNDRVALSYSGVSSVTVGVFTL